jgi:peptidoglycan/LPS O-acetylase OafA/YrhL
MLLISPPYRLFILAAFALLVASFFTANQIVEVHLNDTYYIFDLPTLLWALSFGLFLLWLLYEVNKRMLYSRQLVRVHVLITLVGVAAALGLVLRISNRLQNRPPLSLDDASSSLLQERILWFSILLVAAVQVVFFLNVVIGLVRAWKR